MNKPIAYHCMNPGAHNSRAMCSSCIPIYSTEQLAYYTALR